jgi:hypothetical protein
MGATTAAEARSRPTPLLDRLAPLPPSLSPGSRRTAAISVGSAIVVAVILNSWDPPLAASLRTWAHTSLARLLEGYRGVTGLLMIGWSGVVAGVAGVLVHEAVHVLGGLCAGFRFHSMAIGPIKLDRSWRVSRHRGPLAWSGGWVGMFPVKRDHLTLRAFLLVLAGPAASLSVGAAALALPFTKGLASWMFLTSSMVAGVVELLPVRIGTTAFDGWRLWRLLASRAWSERWLALVTLAADLQHGVPPEALSADDLAKAVGLRDGSIDTLSAHAIAYSAAFHRHDDAEAGRMLETCLQYSGHGTPALRYALMSDAAVFQARRRARADLAAQWLADIPAGPQLVWLRTRVEAAILEAWGDVDGAARKLEEHEAAVLALPLSSEAQRHMLLRSVRKWQAELSRLRASLPRTGGAVPPSPP